MEEIIVRSQKELDAVPTDKECIIKIDFGTRWSPANVRGHYKYRVEALENSSVVAWGNVQVVDYLQGATITIFGNARTVFMPRNIEEFMNFYGIEHNKFTAKFYKTVHKREIGTLYADDGKKSFPAYEYVSDYDGNFKYRIGEVASSDGFNDNVEECCEKGIHISNKSWALDFGRNWGDFALLEVKVKIKDILLPKYSDGKVRAPKVEVIREVPLAECGVYGKILAKRMEIQNGTK